VFIRVNPRLFSGYDLGYTLTEESMAATDGSATRDGMWIEVEADGPYTVHGDVPLVRKTQVVSEYGEPLTWQKDGAIETSGEYQLCRCGQSSEKPFCDCSHRFADWDAAETADARPTSERQMTYPGGTGIVVRSDALLCSESGYCASRIAHIRDMVPATVEPQVRARIMAMVERCPSGSLTYALEEGGPDIEPDLPQQIAVTTEITSDGPIAGPLWVTGSIPVVRSDGQPFETRNRVTLCSCGLSKTKPLCDGTHRTAAVHASP
jgi:CDGSH-type Zn-finger protein